MARLFLTFTFLFILLSASNARPPSTSPEDDVIDRSKFFLPTQKQLDSDTGSAVNIDVDRHGSRKESGKFPDAITQMPASGSFDGMIVDGGKKRLNKGIDIPMMVTWRPINRHLDRLRVIRRSFPVHCRHRRSRLDGGAQIRHRRSPINEEKDQCRRYGKIISARWIDGTTFHRLDAMTIPDVDGEELMIGEFRSPRLIFRRHRHQKEVKEGKGNLLWKKIRKFLINL